MDGTVMDADMTARVIYLGVLLASVGGYVIVQARSNLGRTAQNAAIWGLIFLGAIGAFGLWDDLKSDLGPRTAVMTDGQIDIRAAPDGHFYLTATVQGTNVTFMIDTGASDIVLTQADARAVGIDTASLNYFGQAQTANGSVDTAPVTLDSVTLGDFTDSAVPAVVNGGDLDTSLLGMSYLKLYGLNISSDRLTLSR
jgi:aspartyl protease family protein